MAKKLMVVLVFLLLMSVVACQGAPGLEGPAGSAGPAGPAGTSISSSASLTVSPSVVKAKEGVVILGSGFTPGSTVSVELIATYTGAVGPVRTDLSTKVVEGSIVKLKCNEFAAFRLEAKIGKGTAAGTYTLQAEDENGIKATIPLEVTE